MHPGRLKRHRSWLLALVLLGAVACGQFGGRFSGAVTGPASPTLPAQRRVAVITSATRVSKPSVPCIGRFVAHRLPHTTTVGGGQVEQFESNGTGLAINDLDNDGDLDLVLANLAGTNTILWNDGKLRFRKQALGDGGSRAVTVVDVDADGKQDIVLSHHTLEPSVWRNQGGGRFKRDSLPGVEQKTWAMDWGDVDADGDLDLVSASYDNALAKDLGYGFMSTRSGSGAYLYTQHDGQFLGTQLAPDAQALAIALPGPHEPGLPDILIGNDFGMPDYAWERRGTEWVRTSPFETTTHSTMSLDLGDIDNNCSLELYATDMKPYSQDVRTLARWRPVMVRTPHVTYRGDPQVMENVLQVTDGAGRYRNHAYRRAIDATGWSWSGKFGDLDQDGSLDLYVVNGMRASDLFSYLLNGELVEENQAFRNTGAGRFERVAKWGLASTASGRSMSMADLDGDGDLDIVVNNLEQPTQLFENRLCGGGSLQADLHWPQSLNTRAIGARLLLHTDKGTYRRDIRASSGYLSGDPARAHFGFPAGAKLERLDIRWPDGAASTLDRLTPGTILRVTR